MYYKYFGLRDAPFQFLPSNTLFLSSAHIEGLGALEWAFQEPSGLTLLVGEVGTGKTMLVHALVTRLNNEKFRIAQLTNPTMSFEEMLDVIVHQLRIHPVGRGKLAALQALKTFVTDPDSDERVILIFDEAQGLSDEILEQLRLLSNSRPPERHALQIILVGQPELAQRLTDPKLRALNQRIGARAVLRPLRGDEVHDYVNCLLRAQGAFRELFSPKAMDLVARLSEGLPRKINNLCHNALFLAYSQRSTIVQPRHVRSASAELENLMDAPSAQDNKGRQGWRDIMHWMPSPSSKQLMVGGLLALAVVAGALVHEFGTRHTNARLARAEPDTYSAQRAGDFSNRPSASRDEGEEEAQNQPPAARFPLSEQNANHAGVAQKLASAEPESEHMAASQPQPLAPQPQAKTNSSGRVVPPTTDAPATPNRSTFTNAPAPIASEPPASPELTYAQQRRLEYETRRVRLSFEEGRYRNVIYHAKRALLLDPGNSEMRDMLQRAEAAVGDTGKAASSYYYDPVRPGDGDKTTYMHGGVSSGSRISGVVRYEITEGDAYMRAGKYDLALRKFLTAAVLDPGNADLSERIARARGAKAVLGNSDDDTAGTSPADSRGVP